VNSGQNRGIYLDQSSQYITIDGLYVDGSVVQNGALRADGSHLLIQNSEFEGASGGQHPNNISVAFLDGSNNTIRSNRFHGSPTGYGIYAGSHDNILEFNQFYDNGGYGIHIYNTNQSSVNNYVVRGNTLWNNGFSRSDWGALIVGSGSGHLVYNNILYNNQSGIQVGIAGSNIKVYNNTIYHNVGGAAGIFVNSGMQNVEVRNNIVYQNGAGVMCQDSCPGLVTSNNLTANPNVVDAGKANFHLQGGSPAIDQGVTISTVSTDCDGTPRPQGADYDIGAYEYLKGITQPTNLRIISSN
jgi:hypothetical protein